jgi:hypothetical protein
MTTEAIREAPIKARLIELWQSRFVKAFHNTKTLRCGGPAVDREYGGIAGNSPTASAHRCPHVSTISSTGRRHRAAPAGSPARLDATRAAAHDDPTSPTGAAVRGYAEAVGTEDKNIRVDSLTAQAKQNESDAAYLRYAGNQALLSGNLGATSALMSGDITAADGILKGIGGGLASGGGTGAGIADASNWNASLPSGSLMGI